MGVSILENRTLLGAPGLTTKSDRTLLGAKGIATRSKMLLVVMPLKLVAMHLCTCYFRRRAFYASAQHEAGCYESCCKVNSDIMIVFTALNLVADVMVVAFSALFVPFGRKAMGRRGGHSS